MAGAPAARGLPQVVGTGGRTGLRILLIVDHFGSGGAQRQIVELACGLKRRGHSVEMFAYFPRRDFFRPRLDAHGIRVHEYDKGPGFSPRVVAALARRIAAGDIDVAVSYLNSPNIYAELAKMLVPRVSLVVSERTSYRDDRFFVSAWLRRALHGVADHVVANSQAQCEWLRRKWWLRHRVSCIYNGLDTGLFAGERAAPPPGAELRLVAVGRVGPEKNALNLIRALVLLQRESGHAPQVTWVGEREGGRVGRRYCQRIEALLADSPEVRRRWCWLGVESDVPALLRAHDALIHPSLYEGLPNVVCEALAAGMPVLVSNVCDHPLLVSEGQRGFLFDPDDPAAIAAAIRRLAALGEAQWMEFSRNARRYARENLDVERMIAAYEGLFVQLLAGREGGQRPSRGDYP